VLFRSSGGQENVGVRVPSHPVALALLSEFERLGGLGVAAPSANRFGKVSPTSSTDVQEDLGEYLEDTDQILDGGRSLVGIESTIINCLSGMPEVLRPGFITPEAIAKVTGINVSIAGSTNEIKTPGAVPAHYSPRAKVVLGGLAKSGEGFLALAHIKTPEGSIRLASPLTIDQFANKLYESLRLADQKGLNKIVVIPPDGIGLAIAIRERLNKAANK
jgi:L-threonylcarbamoyladenylate synthase